MRQGWSGFALASILAISVAGCSGNDEAASPEASGDGEGTIELAEFPDRPYWGDTHLHTDNSVDAFGFGTRLGPEAALRFARGETVTATTGGETQLARPLDFLVIADHSDALGATRRLYDAPRWYVKWVIGDDTVLRWYDMMHESPEQSTRAIGELIAAAAEDRIPEGLAAGGDEAIEATKDIWNTQLSMLDRYNEPGVFTALAGYEWTAMPDGNNLHRVVMFRDGSEKTRQTVPFPGLQTTAPQLWEYMRNYEKETGGRVLAIPHNSNLSNGLMFQMTMEDGSPMTAEYAALRAWAEPVIEATQIKGDSETHPYLSPNDEMAGFGVQGWDFGNLSLSQMTDPSMYAGSYARSALLRGLTLEQKLGVNPYAFGMIGSTDSHTSLATGDEDNFWGKHTGNEQSYTQRSMDAQNLGTREGRFGWHYLAGGYAAAWARGNTRAEIFDAFARREVYATTGPRMSVRVFGGFGFTADDWDGDWVRKGYSEGVPMGGELTDEGRAPSFLISAMKDPDGANLDRVQVIKGWLDASGEMQERVYDVVWSDADKRGKVAGKLAPVGDTVDRETATYTNTIGAAELRTTWTDPDYQVGQRPFYYVRVLEIPTPRWTLYDAVRFGVTLSEEAMADAVAQERAYTSPIWLKSAS
ncbi:DUF3604 domain-containing protein [Erythrobacter sp. SCSIO 43205]|uniref:DUF3604 domain-containing protein n=1 Tax=Erythrobacter sp. SCSIO 43205 TaxID=2779361 RepID=UPI001CA8723A|nr:DUF3604 domain-containing protein [Erythrobacter sp. SCSIO 43205]UAB79362.1 DUF3604 domain-containing protein [Erythrobacter sp. SCSIO 43205]